MRRIVGLVRKGERGYTLPEVLTVIAILGILIAIGIIIWLGILERRRVDAATNQLAADMRLANTSATNELADWRLVLIPNRRGEDEGHDYYLIKMVSGATPIGRTFPANVSVRDHDSNLNDAPVNPGGLVPSAPAQTRTLEFNPDGTMAFRLGPAGTVCVTIDDDPQRRVTAVSATSRIKIKELYNDPPCK